MLMSIIQDQYGEIVLSESIRGKCGSESKISSACMLFSQMDIVDKKLIDLQDVCVYSTLCFTAWQVVHELLN